MSFMNEKSDTPLFQWVLALNLKKKIHVMYKKFKTPAVECLENGNYHVYRKLHPKQHFSKWIPAPENCKNH